MNARVLESDIEQIDILAERHEIVAHAGQDSAVEAS
jgi:hypothetical protein